MEIRTKVGLGHAHLLLLLTSHFFVDDESWTTLGSFTR